MMRQRVKEVTKAALQSGALHPIETVTEGVLCAASGTTFLVHVLKSIRRKKAATTLPDPTASAAVAPAKRNPFLPYEEAMFVASAGPRHVVLLNKFPVVDEHLLVVTRQFEEQNSLLTADDLGATAGVLHELGGIAFYNGGRIAGASQRHKHLQVVGAMQPPFAPLLDDVGHAVVSVDRLPFMHFAVGVDWSVAEERRGEMLMERYAKLMGEVERAGIPTPSPYNLVLSKRWMLLVPRREECFHEVSVNSLGFVGCLLVRDAKQLQLVLSSGPMAVLRHTAFGVEGR